MEYFDFYCLRHIGAENWPSNILKVYSKWHIGFEDIVIEKLGNILKVYCKWHIGFESIVMENRATF